MGTLHIHTYSDELPSFNSTSDCDYYEFAVYRYRHSHEHERSHCNGDCDEHLYPATVRVSNPRPAPDAPGGQHKLADL